MRARQGYEQRAGRQAAAVKANRVKGDIVAMAFTLQQASGFLQAQWEESVVHPYIIHPENRETGRTAP
jgi:hypothetical protein